jgi:hypothetical protein
MGSEPFSTLRCRPFRAMSLPDPTDVHMRLPSPWMTEVGPLPRDRVGPAACPASLGSRPAHRWGVVGAGLALILSVSACGDGSPTDAETEVPREIRISVDSISFDALDVGVDLSATVLNSQGVPIPGAQVQWQSDDPGIVSVSGSGQARALANGATRLRAWSGSAGSQIPVEVHQLLASVEGVELELTDVGEVTAPFPFLDARDPNGVALAPDRLAEVLASAQVVEEEPFVPGFLPDPEAAGDSVRLRHAGRVVFELAGEQGVLVYHPAAPELYGVLGSPELQDSGELRLYGPRLDEWANPDVRLSTPAALSLVGRDAVSLVYRVELPEAPCSPAAARLGVEAGIPVRSSLVLRRSGGGHAPVEIGVGEMQRVDQASVCLGVAPGRYLLAFADLGYLERGAVEAMPMTGWDDWTAWHGTPHQVGFRVVDRVEGASAQAMNFRGRALASPGRAGLFHDHHHDHHHGHFPDFALSDLPVMAGGEEDLEVIWARTEPLEVGDRILAPRDTGIEGEDIFLSPSTAVYERERFIVLVNDLDAAEHEARPEIMEQLLNDLDRFLDRGLGTYQEIFEIDYPRLGTPFGQHVLVVSLGPWRWGWNAGFLSHKRLSDYGEAGRPWTAGGKILVHEIAHGFQSAVARRFGQLSAVTKWSLEGGATLMEAVMFEVGAVEWERFAHYASGRCGRWTGCDAAAGDFLSPLQDPEAPFLSMSGPFGYFGISNFYWIGAVTPFYHGYTRSAPIMRRYALQYSRATGTPILEALGAVTRHSLAGFHGDLQGGPPGLIAFLQSVDPEFDPGLEHLMSILDTTPRKSQLGLPEEFLWHDDTKNYFAMHLLAGLGTDYTLPMDRMSHGLLTYDVPQDRELGVLHILPESQAMRYLILRVE